MPKQGPWLLLQTEEPQSPGSRESTGFFLTVLCTLVSLCPTALSFSVLLAADPLGLKARVHSQETRKQRDSGSRQVVAAK